MGKYRAQVKAFFRKLWEGIKNGIVKAVPTLIQAGAQAAKNAADKRKR